MRMVWTGARMITPVRKTDLASAEDASEFERLLAKPKGGSAVTVTVTMNAAAKREGSFKELAEAIFGTMFVDEAVTPPTYNVLDGAKVVRETEKAFLVELRGQEHWFPKSHSMISMGRFAADDWIVLQKRGELSPDITREAQRRQRELAARRLREEAERRPPKDDYDYCPICEGRDPECPLRNGGRRW